MKETKRIRITCAGDSITDCDCVKPPVLKETILMRDLGYGYVNMMYGMLQLKYPQFDLTILNHGVGGDRTIKLLNRFDEVLREETDILSIMIGVNDVWAKMHAFDRPDVQISVDEYEIYLKQMIEKAIKKTKNIILLSPFYLDLSPKNEFLMELLKRQTVMKNLANQYHIQYIDLQQKFAQLIQQLPVSKITSDYIHVNAIGHTLISNELYLVIQEIIEK